MVFLNLFTYLTIHQWNIKSLVWFYGISTIIGYLMPNPFLYIQTVLFQAVQFSIRTQFSSIWPINRTLSGVTTPGQSGCLVWFYGISTIIGYLMPNPFLYIQTVLFQAVQFSIRTQFSSIWPINRTLSGVTTPGQSGCGSNGNEGLLPKPSALLEPHQQIV